MKVINIFFVDLVTSSKIRISLVETRIVPDITLNENVETVLVRECLEVIIL